MHFFNKLNNHLVRKPALKAKRLPTMYPSAASCRDMDNPSIIYGAWYETTMVSLCRL